MSEEFLDLPRCPWCHTATPTLRRIWHYPPQPINPGADIWENFQCSRCQNIILTKLEYEECFDENKWRITQILPSSSQQLDESIPEQARDFLGEAQDAIGSPHASILVCSCALDVMLREKGIKKSEGDLYTRIEMAAQQNLITQNMAKWAHQVRLVANESRHPDEDVSPAIQEEARQSLEFTLALAEILYALPARVTKGLEESAEKAQSEEKEGG